MPSLEDVEEGIEKARTAAAEALEDWCRSKAPLFARFAALARDPRVGAGVHRLPRLQIDGDFPTCLLRAGGARHLYVQGGLTDLANAALSSFKEAFQVAQKGGIRNSNPHGRRNAWCGYRHSVHMPVDQNEVTQRRRETAQRGSNKPGRFSGGSAPVEGQTARVYSSRVAFFRLTLLVEP